MSNTIIITAGGVGKRMGANQPKQFIELKGRPILFYTIEKFLAFDSTIQVILVLPKDHISTWTKLCAHHKFNCDVTIVEGGKERFHSVKNGLKLVKGDIVGIHDAVRPFVADTVINACFAHAKLNGSAIPVIPPKESLRMLLKKDSKGVDRADYVLVQTPQVFSKDMIVIAYDNKYNNTFTDDASVVEAAGGIIHTVQGNDENIKITTPIDLKLATLLLEL